MNPDRRTRELLACPRTQPARLSAARCTCMREEHGRGLCRRAVRDSLSGATVAALVPRAPALDLCPGRLATTDAQ